MYYITALDPVGIQLQASEALKQLREYRNHQLLDASRTGADVFVDRYDVDDHRTYDLIQRLWDSLNVIGYCENGDIVNAPRSEISRWMRSVRDPRIHA